MIPSLRRRVLAVVFALSCSTAAAAQPVQRYWWKMEPTLALSTEQSTKIGGIFQEGIAQLRTQKDELDRLEAKLSHLIEAIATEAEVTQQVDRVEAARSTLNKTRTLMLLHMRQVLKPEQRLKLGALRDRWMKERQERRDNEAGCRPTGTSSPGGSPKHPA